MRSVAAQPIRACLALAIACILVLWVAACGGGGGNKLTIGIKFDQPGLSVKNPDGSVTGFDVDVATYVAQQLGHKPDDIEWKEAPSGQRETLIQ
ncbi:MAG: transporter substrate-binding domain-containing protein, partial [Mycobacteriaceae bacterium]|nr:transporter substrate-binding domain-containing protein [Mycobacteriaceae bacterium]